MSFLSLSYLGLVVGACFALALLRGHARTLGFFAVNATFAWSHLTLVGATCCAAFLLTGYGLTCFARSRPAAKPYAIALLTIAFVFVRRYDFLLWLFPGAWLDHTLRFAGLSFLFFKMIHVLVDCGSKSLPTVSLGMYVNYGLNFTAFLTGPLQRYQSFRDQWNGDEQAIPDTLSAHLDAINRILLGLVKVYVLGEMLAPMILSSAHDLGVMPLITVATKTLLFYLHLYLNFSGYCDIVIGTGCLMGLRPPENFHLPMLAPNVSQFWLRVHRSLTEWLTDYVFTPLYTTALRARSWRASPLTKSAGCLLVTMFVSGLWHGTTLSFLLFGLVHGVFLVLYRIYDQRFVQRFGRKRAKHIRAHLLYRCAATLLTFFVTGLTYVFFAADETQLLELVRRLFT